MRASDVAADDQPTCGKGLAANAAVPARLAELAAATAEVLERHSRALDLSHPDGRHEFAAYVSLARGYRGVAADLAGLAQQMTGYRDLRMAPHDMAIMVEPDGQAAAFERLVEVERELLEVLRAKLEVDERMLGSRPG